MCLSTVTRAYAQPSDLILDGWKEFGGSSSRPEFINSQFRKTRDVPLDEWLTAEAKTEITASDLKPYVPGFHVYADEKPGKVRRRVYVRRVTYSGTQDRNDCVIAEQMYVPSDPDAWPPMEPQAPTIPTTPQSPQPPPSPKVSLRDRLRGKRGAKP